MSRERCWEWVKRGGVAAQCNAVSHWRSSTGATYCDDHQLIGCVPIPTDDDRATRCPDYEWVRTADALPVERDHVLIGGTGHKGWFYAEALYRRGGFWLFDHMADAYIAPCCSPSHWMPLPSPPEEATT